MARHLRRPMLFLLGLTLIYLVFCWQAARSYLHPFRRVPLRPEGVQEVDIDGTPAWATPGLASGKPSRVVLVLVHGYGGSRGSWTPVLADLEKAGIDAVAPAMPGQDASPEETVGFGRKESKTVLQTAAWARAHGAEKVVGLGISLGGGATWLASAEDPKALDGIITDGAFAVFSEAMDSFFSRKLKGGSFLLRPVVWFARVQSGIDPGAIRPVEAAALWKGKPALVIQGACDTLCVPSQGERLAAAASCPIWRIEGAEHAQSYDADPKGYVKRVVDFVRDLEDRPVSTKH